MILIRCDGAGLPEIGTGHVYKDISIAQDLIKGGFCKKTDIVFVSRRDGPFERGYKLLIGAGFSVLWIYLMKT